MEEFIIALVGGLISAAMQHELNRSDVDYQNQYNEGIYKKYNAPTSQAGEMADAGLSDAAIGQALSGYSGQSLTMTSAPMQPTNFDFPSFMDMMIKNKQTDSNIDLNKSNIKLNKELQYKFHNEGIKAGIEAGYTGKQLKYFSDVYDWMIYDKKLNIKQREKEIDYTEAKIRNENADSVIKEFEGIIQSDKYKWMIENVKANIAEKYSNIKLNDKSCAELISRAMFLQQGAAYNRELAKKTGKEGKILDKQYEIIKNQIPESEYNKSVAEFNQWVYDTFGMPVDEVEGIISGVIEIGETLLLHSTGVPKTVKGFR